MPALSGLVSLREITADTVRSVIRLSVADSKLQGRGIGKAALLQVIEHVRGKKLFAGQEVVLELPLGEGI